MEVTNYFREDSAEILGVYCEDEKIFLAYLTSKLELFETNFEIDYNNDKTAIEQLAARIKFVCNERDWKVSKVGFILREGTASTLQTDFKNVPTNEVANAIEIWAKAHVGRNAYYTFVENVDEVWMEALSASIVEEYISAFDKNLMILCALTEIPQFLIDDERNLTPFTCAVFAADIIKNRKTPNLLSEKISNWNFKKISVTMMAVFLIIIAILSANLGYNYFSAAKCAEMADTRLKSFDDTFYLKIDLDAFTGNLRQSEGLIFKQGINLQNFNALVKVGKIVGSEINLDKIKISGETLELEGVAESPDAIKNYLNRLKNLISPKVKLKNSIETEDKIIFSISINLT